MRITIFITGVICVFFASGCEVNSMRAYTMQTEDFGANQKSLKRVICIAPDFKKYTDRDMDNEDYLASWKLKEKFASEATRWSKKSGFNYEVYFPNEDAENQQAIFTKLLPLRRSILMAISNQANSLNETDNSMFSEENKGVFVVNTVLPAEWSKLSDEFDTPYFSMIEMYANNNKSFFIHIIADVVKGRIEYQEIRKYTGKVKPSYLQHVLFDSFSTLKKNFKGGKKK
jgi:hypothetical protein